MDDHVQKFQTIERREILLQAFAFLPVKINLQQFEELY